MKIQRIIGSAGKTVYTSRSNVETQELDIKNAFENDSTIDAFLLSGKSTLSSFVNVLEELNKTNILFGMFDFTTLSADLILSGKMKFAISQQPYLQGYLPVALATIQVATGNGMSIHFICDL